MSTTGATTTPPPEQQILIPSLPNDVALNILARIPRSQHPFLSRVSKSFLSLLSSPLLYTTRSLLHSSQPFLYISLRLPTTRSLHWFTLYPTSKTQQQQQQRPPPPPPSCNCNFLVPVPPTPSPLVGSAFVSVGPTIYVIGGSINDIPSSHVWALDCRFHTWESLPNMNISREFAAAGVVDGRIHVIGGCVVDTWARSRFWAECFDPVARKWEAVESARNGIDMLREKWMHASAVVKGRMYAMADRNGVVYEPRAKRWSGVESELDLGWRGRACVVGDRILYCYDYLGKIRGFDVEMGEWKELKGIENGLPTFLCGAIMANVGGKLVVVWEEKGKGKRSGKEMEVWCAQIEVEKKGEKEELWGRIEWCEIIHRVPSGSSIVHCLAVTV